jgi:hypothetical protein
VHGRETVITSIIKAANNRRVIVPSPHKSHESAKRFKNHTST